SHLKSRAPLELGWRCSRFHSPHAWNPSSYTEPSACSCLALSPSARSNGGPFLLWKPEPPCSYSSGAFDNSSRQNCSSPIIHCFRRCWFSPRSLEFKLLPAVRPIATQLCHRDCCTVPTASSAFSSTKICAEHGK